MSLVINNISVHGVPQAIKAIRNYHSSWDKSDSYTTDYGFIIGENDHKLARNLIKAGKSSRAHCKFLRMIHVWMDISGPFKWWKQFDTYKIGVNCQSTSTMNSLMKQPLSVSDFETHGSAYRQDTLDILMPYIQKLNDLIEEYKTAENEEDKVYLRNAVEDLLPSSYRQLRTIELNYEVLANIYHDRKGHKLSEWADMCHMIEDLPFSWLITGEGTEEG